MHKRSKSGVCVAHAPQLTNHIDTGEIRKPPCRESHFFCSQPAKKQGNQQKTLGLVGYLKPRSAPSKLSSLSALELIYLYTIRNEKRQTTVVLGDQDASEA